MLVIIFSKDRPIQLDLLLRSMETYVHGPMQCLVITKGNCYQRVFAKHSWAIEHKQTRFSQDLVNCLSHLQNRHVMFLVDDTVFVQHVNLARVEERIVRHDAIGYSLRLGNNVNYCYMHDEDQKLVDATDHGDYLSFNWKRQEYDWGYPMDVSSSVFNLSAMYQLTCKLGDIANPNQFEAYLASVVTKDVARRSILLCEKQSAAYSIPLNLVQTQYIGNRHDGTYTVEHLLHLWETGHRISLDKIPRIPNSVHMVVQVEFESC